jgi:hypothetical protein
MARWKSGHQGENRRRDATYGKIDLPVDLHQRPFMRYTQVRKVKEIQQDDYGCQYIVLHPVLLDPSPDHDA